MIMVVLADLGHVGMSCPALQCQSNAQLLHPIVPHCSAQYSSPEMLLRSHHVGSASDLWSLGCVAAELFLRVPLFTSIDQHNLDRRKLDHHFTLLGLPLPGSITHTWLTTLPLFKLIYGNDAHRIQKRSKALPVWPPQSLRHCPTQLSDFIKSSLQLHPIDRWTARTAAMHSFVLSRPLSVSVPLVNGKHGLSSIADGNLDDDVLEYLQ
jgi:serine/threonine protein kinase